MLEKAQQIISEYEETLKQLSNPEISKDLDKFKNLAIVISFLTIYPSPAR